MISVAGRKLRILDFDIENRPLSYLGPDFTTAEVTSIAWKFIGEGRRVKCQLLGQRCYHPECDEWHIGLPLDELLDDFMLDYNAADMVTGHYIRGHDLVVLNGMLLELGRPPLEDKLAHDTKLDLVKRKYVSGSQESIAAMLGIRAPKVQMDQAKWREANRLTPEGLALTRKRAMGDVRQHIQMRARLLELGWLNPPRVWESSNETTRYTP
jgi:hypothetical protein